MFYEEYMDHLFCNWYYEVNKGPLEFNRSFFKLYLFINFTNLSISSQYFFLIFNFIDTYLWLQISSLETSKRF